MPVTVTVKTNAELVLALNKAQGGDTVLLEGGNYGALNLVHSSSMDVKFPSTVTVKSKDAGNPAVFTKADVRDAENLVIDGVKFDYVYKAGDKTGDNQFSFSFCKNLTIRNSELDGDLAKGTGTPTDGHGYGTGLYLRSSTNVVIENNEVSKFYRGIATDGGTNVTLRGNDLHSMRMDGITVSQNDGILIEGNRIHDFDRATGSGDHCDMIQFWTEGDTAPSKNITIRGNVLDIGEGDLTQSIFIRNELVDTGRASMEAMAYRNVLIENNTIINAHQWGISLGETIGGTIRNNAVLHGDGRLVDGVDHPVEIPLINVAGKSTGITVTGNLTSKVTGHAGQAGWVVSGNVAVQDQDPRLDNHYSKVFLTSTTQTEDGRHVFQAVDGGLVDKSGAGSTLVTMGPKDLAALFHVEETSTATRVFDASHSLLDGKAVPAGASYAWTFGDGTTAQGIKVSHTYVDGGKFPVSLTIRLPDGRTDTASFDLPVQSPEVVRLGSRGFVATVDGAEMALGAVAAQTAEGIQLGVKATVASVARAHVEDVVGSRDLSIAFSLDADKAGASGEVFRLHGSFWASVTTAGELSFSVVQQGGPEVRLTTKGAGLNAAVDATKTVLTTLDDGVLEVWVDGSLKGSAAVAGAVGGLTGYDTQNLIFGNAWAATNFNGDLKSFELKVDEDAFPLRPQTTVLVGATPVASTPRPTPASDVDLLLAMDADGFVAFNGTDAFDLGPAPAVSANGVQIADKYAAASIDRAHLKEVMGSDSLAISFTLDADQAGTTGEVLRLHGAFTAIVERTGELSFSLTQADGKMVKVTSTGIKINDGEANDVVVSLEDGSLALWIDGQMAASADFAGTISQAKAYGHALTFGNQWGSKNFVGDVRSFEASVDEDFVLPGEAAAARLVMSTLANEVVEASALSIGFDLATSLPGWDPYF